MPAPTYLTTCPNCGAPLEVVVALPDVAPWACWVCHRGWWPSELTPVARSAWRSATGDWGTNGATIRALDANRTADLAAASKRGVSLLPEQMSNVDPGTLAKLHTRFRLDPSFAADVTAAANAHKPGAA